MNAPVVVLLSVGRSAVSGRPRPAERDARAVSAALELTCPVIGLHAGAEHDVLRSYLGMGLSAVVVLALPDGADPVPAIAAYLTNAAPRLVLSGSRAETGDGSGLLPYEVARILQAPLVPSVAAVSLGTTEEVEVLQALAGGRRRRLRGLGPLVATVDLQGPSVRQIARGLARRGSVTVLPTTPAEAVRSYSPEVLDTRPSRARPRRIGPASASSDVGGRLLVAPEPRDAAAEILRLLERERIIAPLSATPHTTNRDHR